MPEKSICENEARENREEKETEKKDISSEDQKKRRYYYDDAHGYEVYSPDDEDED